MLLINIDALKVVGLMDAILTARATLVTAVQWVKRDNSPPSSYPSPKIWDWVQNSFKNPRGINLNKQCPFIYLLHTEIITCPGIQKSYVQQSSCLRLEVLNHDRNIKQRKTILSNFWSLCCGTFMIAGSQLWWICPWKECWRVSIILTPSHEKSLL